ncbi:MAG: hypothetical protein KBB11_08355 [Bacteroidales bacterium]|nr:hypothetical protein [Bacteroidales bacterium]HOY38358.1 hypothetical protein [Bacteroidales bacterium]
MKTIIYALIIGLTVCLTSCKIHRELATVSSGGGDVEKVIVKNNQIDGVTENQTLFTYKKNDQTIMEEVDPIDFVLVKKEKAKVYWGINKERYAVVNVNKYFYVYSGGKVFLKIILAPFTYFTSLFWIKAREITPIEYETCNYDDLCKGHTYDKQILIEAKIWCKRDRITDTVTIVESFPDAIKFKDYKVKVKRGDVEKVIHEVKTENSQSYHVFKIVGDDNMFEGKNKVWIIMDVAITPTEEYYKN